MRHLRQPLNRVRSFLAPGAADQPILVWEYFAMSAILAGLLSTQIRVFSPQNYSQLIVGYLAWGSGAKKNDYLIVLLTIAFTILFYWGISKLGRLIEKKHGVNRELAYRQLSTYCMIPASLWLGTQLTGGNSLGLLWVSAVAVIALVLCSGISVWLPLNFRGNRLFFDCLLSSLLTVLLAPINGIAGFLLWGRLHLSSQVVRIDDLVDSIYILIQLSLLLVCLVWILYQRNSLRLDRQLRLLLLISQGLIPFLFLVLIPSPWSNGSEIYFGYSVTKWLIFLVLFLIAGTYVDLLQRLRHLLRGKPRKACFVCVSPWVLLAILLFLKTASPLNPVLSADDYHFGEFLLPWWLWTDFSYLPFQDYFPARGLINYLPGLLADIFFDGTAAAYTATYVGSLLALPYLSIGLFFISNSIGLLPAFIALALMPAPSGIFEIDIVLTAALCFLAEAFLHQRWTRWLVAWVVLGMALILFAPGQGGLFILATSPLGGMALYKALLKERKKLLYGFSVLLLAMLLIALLTPLDQMLVGAIRYGVEQSSVNSIAYGIPWADSQGSNPIFGYVLWEIVRSSWIWVGGIAALLLYRIGFDPIWPDRQRFMAFALPIVLFAVLWIPRAAGRIDPGSWSRLGIASFWFVCLLLPILLLVSLGHRHEAKILLVISAIGGLVSTFPPNLNTLSLEQVVQFPAQIISIEDGALTDGQELGLPNLGKVFMEPSQRHRLEIIKAVLDLILEPGETYLDMTNRNAQYFYLGYPPPVESGAVYNLVHKNQQIRAIAALEASQPPLILADADSILHDGGTAALRAHLLYRYAVEHYVPVQIEGYIFMIQPDRLTRLGATQITQILDAYGDLPGEMSPNTAGMALLDQAFLVPNLHSIPSAWGQSLDSLTSELNLVKNIDNLSVYGSLKDVESAANPRARTTNDPDDHLKVAFDISSLELRGQDAGLLVFEFTCENNKGPTGLNVYWTTDGTEQLKEGRTGMQFTAHNGLQLLPLDAAPRWLSADQLKTIEIELVDPDACPNFRVSNVSLFQRSSIAQAAQIVIK